MRKVFGYVAPALWPLILALNSFAQQPDFGSFDRRLTDLERRVVALERNAGTALAALATTPAVTAPQAGYPQAQQRYTVDAQGVYWPAGSIPAAGYAAPQAYYGGGFGDAGGGCAGGSCGGGSSAGGYRFAPFGGAFRRR